jgi:hypothetical protein
MEKMFQVADVVLSRDSVGMPGIIMVSMLSGGDHRQNLEEPRLVWEVVFVGWTGMVLRVFEH